MSTGRPCFHRTTALPQLRGRTYAPVEGGAFVVEAPREDFYVRSLAVHLQRLYGRTYFAAGQLNREIWDELVVCDDNLRVSPQPEDEHIYVGALTCRHADGVPIGVEVADELEALRPQLPPGLHIARRIATRDTPLTPIDPALRVPRSRGGVRARLRN